MGKLLGFTLCFFLVSQTNLLSDPLEEARKAEQKGDAEGTYTAYVRWLESEKDLDNQVETLFHAIDGIPDLERTLKFLDATLAKLKDPVNRSRIFALQASLWERMGAFESAEKAYREAYEAHPVPASLPYLVRSSCLLYELGEVEGSEKQIRFILSQTDKPEDRWEAQFHLARIFAITHRVSDAWTVGKRLLEEADSYGKDPQTLLYFLYTVSGELGMKKEQETYRMTLEQKGGLLKHFIAPQGKSKILPLPLPSLFFSGMMSAGSAHGASPSVLDKPPTPPTPTSSPSSTPRATSIQVGSFSHKENAEYLAKDLRKFGFPAVVKQSQWKDGSTLYRTLIPLGTDPSVNPQTLLIQLKEYGYEGFFLFESNEE